MRLHEYRAWDKTHKRWWTHQETLSLLLFQGRIESGAVTNADDVLDNFVVEQFTGLYDKDGVKIFEGDVIDVEGCVASIAWSRFCWLADWADDCAEPLERYEGEDITVIGNIHENPEMIAKEGSWAGRCKEGGCDEV